MPTVADLIQTPPPTGIGALIGVGDWRLVVEALVPSAGAATWGDGSVAGTGVWNDSAWSAREWLDITDDVQGAEWTRGATEPEGRPRVGEFTLTLDSSGGKYDPWNPAAASPDRWSPGLVIRIGVRSPTDTRASGWLPQICGIVDEWGQSTAGNGASKTVTVTGFETLRYLAALDEPDPVGATGGGEDIVERISRILDAASWPFGLDVENLYGASPTLRATTLEGNRLEECYLTADSTGYVFRTSRRGAAMVYQINEAQTEKDLYPILDFSYLGVFVRTALIKFDWRGYVETSGMNVVAVPYDADSFRTANSDDVVLNDVRLTRVAGTQQIRTAPASISRYGRRSLIRDDLLTQSDGAVLNLATAILLDRARTSMRVESVEVATSDRGDDAYLALLAADIDTVATVYAPDALTSGDRVNVAGRISNLTHRVVARSNGSVTWSSVVGFYTTNIRNLPGAELPIP